MKRVLVALSLFTNIIFFLHGMVRPPIPFHNPMLTPPQPVLLIKTPPSSFQLKIDHQNKEHKESVENHALSKQIADQLQALIKEIATKLTKLKEAHITEKNIKEHFLSNLCHLFEQAKQPEAQIRVEAEVKKYKDLLEDEAIFFTVVNEFKKWGLKSDAVKDYATFIEKLIATSQEDEDRLTALAEKLEELKHLKGTYVRQAYPSKNNNVILAALFEGKLAFTSSDLQARKAYRRANDPQFSFLKALMCFKSENYYQPSLDQKGWLTMYPPEAETTTIAAGLAAQVKNNSFPELLMGMNRLQRLSLPIETSLLKKETFLFLIKTYNTYRENLRKAIESALKDKGACLLLPDLVNIVADYGITSPPLLK